MTRAYSNFSVPSASQPDTDDRVVTLVDQAEQLDGLLPAADAEPATSGWTSTLPHMDEAVRLYREGRSLSSIARELGIAWDSVARLLDRAEIRVRRNKSQ